MIVELDDGSTYNTHRKTVTPPIPSRTTRQVAWVSGIKPTGYTLHVTAPAFAALDGARFTTASAAFAIQRAIRGYQKEMAR